jgi:acetylornithine deacetylase
MSDVVALAAEIMSIPSISGNEGAVTDFVTRWLVARGWNVNLQQVTQGRANVWATRGRSVVTLSTHLDTVPPFVPPRLDGDRLFGRGACDAKGIAASMLVAASELADQGENRVGLLFVVGEEKNSDGARAANQLSPGCRFLVNGEPTESRLASGAKGSLRVMLRTRGREAHSAYPHLGVSALKPMLELLPGVEALEFPSDPELGQTTANIGVLRAGTEANIVPGLAEAEIMFRLVGPAEPVRKMIEAWVGGHAELEYGSHIPAQRFHTLPGFEVAAMAYTSDIPLLSRWGTPLLFGPGSIHVAHTPEEHVSIAELRESVDAYKRIIAELLVS